MVIKDDIAGPETVPAWPVPVGVIRNARLPDGTEVDLRLAGGVVRECRPAGSLPEELHEDDPEAVLDLDGRLLLTAPAEPHAHLDKALTFDLIDPPFGDLRCAVGAWLEYAATMDIESIIERARTQALKMLASGITAIRSHVDVHPGFPTRGAEALVAVREELRGLIDLELVALASPDASDADVEAVLDLGVDAVGGAPHLAEDPQAEVERLVAIAQRRGLGIDLHTDENLDGPLTLGHYARLVQDLRRDRQYSAGHCCRLATLEPRQLSEIVQEVAAADIGIISLPITNLYLQGWDHPVSKPRGLTALRALLDGGVRVAAGADNVQDPFNPVGRSDAFETASLLVVAGHLSPAEAWSLVTDGARSVMGLAPAGARRGARAEFLAVPSPSLTAAIAEAPASRLVIHNGQIVARSQLHQSVAHSCRATKVGAK